MKMKNVSMVMILGTVAFVSLSASAKPETVPVKDEAVQLDDSCGSNSYKCGYGQTWTCCNSGDRCCSYTATDNRTWYKCVLSGQSCD